MGFFNEEKYVRQSVKCDDCPLNYRNKVWGEGNCKGNNGLIFLGEAPGANEDKHGRPFVGRAGKILNKALKEVGIHRFRSWVTNVINCQPPQNNFQATDTKIALKKHCAEGLYEELDFLYNKGFRIIVPLGRNACGAFDINGKMGDIRGNIYNFNKYTIIPTYHPSYIARKGGVGSVEWYYWLEDFQSATREYVIQVI